MGRVVRIWSILVQTPLYVKALETENRNEGKNVQKSIYIFIERSVKKKRDILVVHFFHVICSYVRGI